MSKKKKVLDSWRKDYKCTGEILGEGGNGKVYIVEKCNERYAIKILNNNYIYDKRAIEKRERFKREIKIVVLNVGKIPGILPIIDYNVDEFWYTMPIAEPIMNYVKEHKFLIDDIIRLIIKLADTLMCLHSKNICHRDIKPSNIYVYNNKPCFSDFGLVNAYEDETRCTKSNNGLGPIFAIAPEMKRNPKTADGKKADVFSLAKTMWMLLVGNELGFDGIYDSDEEAYSLLFVPKFKGVHLVELEELLHDSTLPLPDDRPTIAEFKIRLENYLKIKNDNTAVQNSEWKFLSNLLFGKYTPHSTIWTNIETIVNVLNTISRLPVYNHMFLPNKGGMDLESVEYANEEGCIYVYTSPYNCYVVKPKKLYFEGYDDDIRWNYFLLELDELEPIELVEYERDSEYLVEDYPGHYVSGKYSQYGVYDYDTGERLPNGYRVLVRYLSGKFLITEKYGAYNKITGAYDARHNMCSVASFREYMDSLRKITNEVSRIGIDGEEFCNQLDLKFFRENSVLSKDEVVQKNKITLETFILNNIEKWSFKEFLNVESERSKAKFCFRLHSSDRIYLSSSKISKIYTLCMDGVFRESDEIEIYYVFGKENARNVYKMILNKLIDECCEKGYEKQAVECLLKVEMVRVEWPTHIINKGEIESLMREADDREVNIIVLDEEGYPHIIHEESERIWYPVFKDAWVPWNIDVGKYSKLSSLNSVYEALIFDFYRYLQEEKQMFSYAYGNNISTEKCIEDIKKLIGL